MSTTLPTLASPARPWWKARASALAFRGHVYAQRGVRGAGWGRGGGRRGGEGGGEEEMVGMIVWHLQNVDLEDLGRAEARLVDWAGGVERDEAGVDRVDVRRRLLENWRPSVDALRNLGIFA